MVAVGEEKEPLVGVAAADFRIAGSLSVSEAVATRCSVRAYLDRPVSTRILRDVVGKASRAPSGGNLQPWHVTILSGRVLREFCEEFGRSIAAAPEYDSSQYEIYPSSLPGIYDGRRRKVGEDMYGQLGIARDDRAGRRAWFNQNYRFFGAPVGLFIHMPAAMGPAQYSDLGMWMQTMMLLLRETGLDSCAQECWSLYHARLRALLPLPQDHLIFAGMAIGYRDPEAAVNQLRTDRAAIGETAQFLGFEDE